MYRSLFLTSLLAGVVSTTKTPIDSELLATLERYAAFASAAYSSDCSVPPYGSVVENYIDDVATSTQVTLFRDDASEEYILSFRGTSDVQDFLTDLDQDLVSCVAPGLDCSGCTVRIMRSLGQICFRLTKLTLITHDGNSAHRVISGSIMLSQPKSRAP